MLLVATVTSWGRERTELTEWRQRRASGMLAVLLSANCALGGRVLLDSLYGATKLKNMPQTLFLYF
jgi:hypothetical protein